MIQKIITSLLASGLLLSYPIYVAYRKENGGIFLALVIIAISIVNIIATSWLTFNNYANKRSLNINAGVFFVVLSLCIAVCLIWNFTKGMDWQYYLSLLVNIACAILLLFQLQKNFSGN
ncbi:MAG: hypothetical protein JSS98_17760 [Bacteroidetes bacterium]|nr:hypothetical protein [Bacteroidota bacterium]